jgi:hypothetical protein
MLCATSCVLLAVGMPVPISRNCLIPPPTAMNRTARPRNRRFAVTPGLIVGVAAMAISAAFRSASKLSLPSSQ